MFWDPEGAAVLERQRDRSKARAGASSGDRGTPHDSGSKHNIDENYTPLAAEYWKQPFLDMKDLHVIKMPRVLQVLFYMLGFEREDICERDTNKLDFKKASAFIGDDLFKRMAQYNPLGQRQQEFKEY